MYAYYSPSDRILQQGFSFFPSSDPFNAPFPPNSFFAFAGKIDIPFRIMYNKMLLIMSAGSGHPTLKKRR